MATFELELVSPERLLLSRPVEMATIPAAEGDIGVLPGHAPMIVALKGGVITVRENGQDTERLFVAGGVAANAAVRGALQQLADEAGLRFVAPPPALCTDNAAMIAWAGGERLALGLPADVLDVPARPRWPLDPGAAAVRGAGVKA